MKLESISSRKVESISNGGRSFYNWGSESKGIIKTSGYFEFYNISNSLCSYINKISPEKANRRIACNKGIHQQSFFGPFMQRGTKLVNDKFKVEQRKVNSDSETRISDLIRCLHDGMVSSQCSDHGPARTRLPH